MQVIYHRPIPSSDPRLKRHVRHDSESRRFEFPTSHLAVVSATHDRQIPILDQGQAGSCTGNAGIGCLGTAPLYQSLAQLVAPAYALDEDGAVHLYSDAETLDGDGPYPPNDNGSDGLSIAKVLQKAGMISGYQHTFSLDAALKAVQVYPIMIGINWYESMFNPAADGKLTVSGQVAGGHEVESRQVDAANKRIWIDNSWGTSWGVNGRAYLTFDDFGRLLNEQGDVTVLLPITAPAPTPAPNVDSRMAAALRKNNWVNLHHVGGNKIVADEAKMWLQAKGL